MNTTFSSLHLFALASPPTKIPFLSPATQENWTLTLSKIQHIHHHLFSEVLLGHLSYLWHKTWLSVFSREPHFHLFCTHRLRGWNKFFSVFHLPPSPTTAPPPARLRSPLNSIVILCDFYLYYNFKRQLAVAEKPDQGKFRLIQFLSSFVSQVLNYMQQDGRTIEPQLESLGGLGTKIPKQAGTKGGWSHGQNQAADWIQWERKPGHCCEQEATNGTVNTMALDIDVSSGPRIKRSGRLSLPLQLMPLESTDHCPGFLLSLAPLWKPDFLRW